MFRYCVLSAIVVLGSGCQPEARAPSESDGPRRTARPSIIFTETDAGRPLRVPVGRGFGIRLRDNASIGYVWSVEQVPSILRDGGFLYDGEGNEAAGAPTSKTFLFTPVRPGRGSLRMALEYRDDPSRTLSFEVVAE